MKHTKTIKSLIDLVPYMIEVNGRNGVDMAIGILNKQRDKKAPMSFRDEFLRALVKNLLPAYYYETHEKWLVASVNRRDPYKHESMGGLAPEVMQAMHWLINGTRQVATNLFRYGNYNRIVLLTNNFGEAPAGLSNKKLQIAGKERLARVLIETIKQFS